MSSKKTQFKKGRSGNPKGRPRGAQSADTYAAEFLSEANAPIAVSVDGRRQTMSVLRAGMKQLLTKAAAGDLPAIKEVLNRFLAIQAAEAKAGPKETYSYNARDREIIDYVYSEITAQADPAEEGNFAADTAPEREP